MKDHIVKIKDISKIFMTKSGSLELFTNINVNFCSSTSYAIIGESGVGKSTLMHIASGLEKPSNGAVFFGEQNFWDLKASSQALLRLNETAIIFQQYNLIPCLSVRENIEFQARINKKHNKILKASHPSPLSAHRGFFGCKHFSKINNILKHEGASEIDWQLK